MLDKDISRKIRVSYINSTLPNLAYDCSIDLQRKMYLFTLSESPEKEIIIKKLEELNIKNEHDLLQNIHLPEIYTFFTTTRKVQRQLHKLKGLLRFKEIEGGYLYASFDSEFDILHPLAVHFAYRLNTEKIILHDIRRNKAMYAEKGQLFEIEFTAPIPPTTQMEQLLAKLWTNYFHTIAIEARTNKKLQSQFVPKKFQHWIVEFQNDTSSHSSNSSQLPLF